MLDFPPVTHPVVIGVRIVHVRTVLSFLEFVGQSVPVRVDGSLDGNGITADVFFNGALETTDFFTGLEEPGNTHEKRPKNEG